MSGTTSGFAAIFRRGWWAVLLRGLLAVAFAALVWLLSDTSLATLVSLFATLAPADGPPRLRAPLRAAGPSAHTRRLCAPLPS